MIRTALRVGGFEDSFESSLQGLEGLRVQGFENSFKSSRI